MYIVWVNSISENKWVAYVMGLTLFFAFIRYYGYDCDAALYLLQAFNYMQPERFVNDVPFMFGNQDSFSIVSPILSMFFKTFGVNVGGMVATLLLQLSWCLLALCFVKKWCKQFECPNWFLPVFFTFILVFYDKTYDYGNFQNATMVIDPYLVARLFSQVFSLAALAFIFHKNKWISLAFFVVASLMHPLVGGWGLPLWLFIFFPKVRIPIIAVSLLAPLSGFLHIGRFDFYTKDWLSGNMYYTPTWNDTLVYTSFGVFWFTMYRKIRNVQLSRFSLSMLLVLLVGVYLHYMGCYVEHVLLYQVQCMRVLWLCIIPVIPVFAFYLRERLTEGNPLTIRDCAVVYIAVSALAQSQWLILLVLAIACIFVPCKLFAREVNLNPTFVKAFFGLSFLFLIVNAVLGNFVQLALEQGMGNTGWAVKLINFPEYLFPIAKILLALMMLICFAQRKYWLAFAFALSFCDKALVSLPLFAIVFYLCPSMSSLLKKLLLAFAITLSFTEMLTSLDGSPVQSAVFVGFIFCMALCGTFAWSRLNKKGLSVYLAVACVGLLAWDVFKWDARDETYAQNERQMDAFLDAMIFPQVKDRGKILFVVDNEAPIQSRINLLTGAYADASVYVGEIFFKDQFKESNRRRSALLSGTSALVNLVDYETKIHQVYTNLDTLISRVDYLCQNREITYFATDHGNVPLAKTDSTYLDVREKWVFLYQCPN